jgi:prepilin-type N-terminal cleavage/methylation domain-containing protein
MARSPRQLDARGFSLIELMLVVAILGTVAAMAALVSPAYVNHVRSESGLAQVVDVVKAARDTAIGSRRNVEIRFIGNNGIRIVRQDVPAGQTIIRTVEFEGRMRLQLVPGLPDTPDAFGNGTPTAFGPTPARMFTSEGTLVDSNGDPLNGSIFLADPAERNSARAITIFGATGAIRTWRWSGSAWQEAAQ